MESFEAYENGTTTTRVCLADPAPALGDTRGCCVATVYVTRTDAGSGSSAGASSGTGSACEVRISSGINPQKAGCSNYPNPNSLTKAYLEGGIHIDSPSCPDKTKSYTDAELKAAGLTGQSGDVGFSCTSCPTSVEVTSNLEPRRVILPLK
jgi:hypothetical protein